MTAIKRTKYKKPSSHKKTKKFNRKSIIKSSINSKNSKNSDLKGKKKSVLKRKHTRNITRNKKYHRRGGKKTVKRVIINSSKKSRKKTKITKVNKLVDVSEMKGGSGRQLNELMNRCYEFFEYQDKRDSRRSEFKLNAKKRHLKNKFKQNIRKSRRFVKRLKLYRNDILRENYPHREDIEEYLTIIDILSMFRNTEQVRDIEAKYKFNDFLMTNEFYKHLRMIYNDNNFNFAIKALADRKIYNEFNKSIKMIEALLKNIERMDVIQFCQIIERYRDHRQQYRGRGNYAGRHGHYSGNYYNYPGYGVSYV